MSKLAGDAARSLVESATLFVVKTGDGKMLIFAIAFQALAVLPDFRT
jgi:hypothetical protein